MDYSLTEDQAAIAELAEKIFREQVNDTAQAEYQDSFNAGLWQTLADAGLTGIGLAEQHGGSAMGFIAQCLVVKAQGAVLAQIPLLETLLAAQALETGGVIEGLARVAAGKAWLSLSLGPGLNLEDDTLQGELSMVPWAEGALYLVARAGERLVALTPAEADVQFEPQRVSNGRPTSRVLVRRAKALDLGGQDAIAALQQRQQVMTAALQLGVAEEALRRTAAYTSERKQFGKPLAAFQAVAHRAA
ncbi:MAG: acyl-CoA dehydrogenase family protein, partial [Alloalcanivorax xenomutans]